MLRHFGGRDQVLLDVVETAAMDLPFLAMGALRQALALAKPKIERDEVEGRADPGYRGDDVQPAHGKSHPFPGNGIFVHDGSPAFPACTQAWVISVKLPAFAP